MMLTGAYFDVLVVRLDDRLADMRGELEKL